MRYEKEKMNETKDNTTINSPGAMFGVIRHHLLSRDPTTATSDSDRVGDARGCGKEEDEII